MVESRIHPKVTGDTGRAAAGRTRRALALVDPAQLRAIAVRARSDRDVSTSPGEPGMTDWVATLPTVESMQCKAAVDARALVLRGDHPELTAGQARADALVDLILGNATITATVALTIPVQTVVTDAPDDHDHDHDPDDDRNARRQGRQDTCTMGWHIPGIGIIDGSIVTALCEKFSTRITRILLDETTGVIRETSSDTYRPPKAVETFVKRRDGTCRFPACTVPASRCDLDHRRSWPIGTTKPTELACLCRHHHRAKTFSGWTYQMSPDAVITWTSPHGQQYVTQPVNHHDLVA